MMASDWSTSLNRVFWVAKGEIDVKFTRQKLGFKPTHYSHFDNEQKNENKKLYNNKEKTDFGNK